MTPTEFAHNKGLEYGSNKSKEHKKALGQYFTSCAIASFMASLVDEAPETPIKICDPGAGHGLLSCALVERLVKLGVKNISIDLFEIDEAIHEVLKNNLEYLIKYYAEDNVIINYNLYGDNFLIWANENYPDCEESYDYVISNPPYFKLNKGDKNVKASSFLLEGITNIYAGFIAMGIKLTKISGDTIFIVPRSFSSGLYFKSLREFLFKESRLKRIHLFKSRTEAFKEDKVLQETIIFKANNKAGVETKISISEGIKDLKIQNTFSKYQITDLIDLESNHKILHLPTNSDDFELIQSLRKLKFRLSSHSIKVSTGRVVAFRSKNNLKNDNKSGFNVPLIWNFNISQYALKWPVIQDKKPQFIDRINPRILVPSQNYVLQRRFSAKEDKKRIICAPFIAREYDFNEIGFENKTNFMYRTNGELSDDLVYGLCVLFNSSIYDRYFRMINGNVNVSSTEMSNMPIPSLEKIIFLGAQFKEDKSIVEDEQYISSIVFSDKTEPVTV